ncbi:MAG: carbamoyl-phosphate synthase large subunit [Planctomycetota bacterium]|nr:carbamoyl-phosphate synthase large subunit [Planctomycetota bacterium]MEC9234102.1 carbamoyl-phosphate synthase large subunit [Planctomycetota bacterium]
MPRRDDLNTILIIGSGPIVIGQGCEFDYSGTQACKALREDGYRIVLVNSNPATIMTDPALSDRTYIEPITPEAVERIIIKEAENGTPIDALLPTLGGQTALNCACALHDAGTLEKHSVQMIGADREVIRRAEDREVFHEIVERVGLKQPLSRTVETLEEAHEFLGEIGLPAIIRPAYTLGGHGGGIAYNLEEFEDIVRRGLNASMISQVLIDQSVLGWKEYELEVVRDANDNCVVVCGIENIDAMGVHTGDSITVAPIMTLSDKEYQRMRDAAFLIMREVGVDTGGSNVQFGINPADGEMVVVEMNPRVSRSSALASKATGFPIARIAAKLAVGYTLDELGNQVTGTTSACFEPSIDYVVTKMPRWTFEKFPEADETLTTQMKSVGEGMSIGRTFKESLQKAIRSMEVKRFGYGLDRSDLWLTARRAAADGAEDDGSWPIAEDQLHRKLSVPSQGRLYYVRYAMKMGYTDERIHELTRIDPWFLDQFRELVEFEDQLCAYERLEDLPELLLRRAKELGYSDPQLASLYLGEISAKSILSVRAHRKSLGIEPVFKLVDTCAAEFEAATPYFYSTYESAITRVAEDGTTSTHRDDEIRITDRPKIVILGGGPNRVGQGIEFDYCCCQASFACEEMGFESVMINSNPETVSTDFDTSDLLFFEPLTLEDVLDIVERLNGGGAEVPNRSGGVVGCIVQFGGQTPLNLAHGLVEAGVPLIGTGLDAIDLAEDRDRFKAMLDELGLRQPENGIAYSLDDAVEIADRIGYPVLVRPSYVLGGRGMETCFDEDSLRRYMSEAVDASELADAPVLIDRFLSEAIEIDVDVVADYGLEGESRAIVCGVMEHIEEAGIHSGDSTCIVPPYSLSRPTIERIRDQARRLAERLSVRGLMNVQMAVKDDEIYIIEVNPRASRTAPFISKATGVSWARVAAKVMMGAPLESLDVAEVPAPGFCSVKRSVFPFSKFPGVDVVLGPEMRSTGEVMGADRSLAMALAKAQMSCNHDLPVEGSVFLSVRDSDKPAVVEVARGLVSMGFTVFTTGGTHALLADHSVETSLMAKISEGARPNILDKIANGEIDLLVNTPTRKGADTDEGRIRAAAVRHGITLITTLAGARAAVQGISALRSGSWGVTALQDYFPEHVAPPPGLSAPPQMATH